MKNSIFKRGKILIVIVMFSWMSITQSSGINIQHYSLSTLKGDTLYVGGSGPGNYTKIQDAITDANNGDTVFVYDDSAPYFENLIVDKSINLLGEDKETTIIDGSGNGDVLIIVIEAIINGFSIKNSGNSHYNAGIKVRSNYNNILNNSISNNRHGILIEHSGFNFVSSNNITDINAYGIHIINNSYFNNISDNRIASSGNAGMGIGQGSNNNNITNNSLFDNGDGIKITASNNNMSGNIIDCSRMGIWLSGQIATNNIVNENKITNCTNKGIFCSDQSNFNIITNNNFSSSPTGLCFQGNSHDNIISGNTFYSNSNYGIRIDLAPEPNHNNTIYHNNFIDNVMNAIDPCNNTWDDGYPSGGNYWDDYTGEDDDDDGIGDTPYIIPGIGNQDNYPLMEPWPKEIPLVPDLECDGILSWSEVSPGATVTDSFTVENIGDPKSLLDWEIYNHPSWGEWMFDIESGEDLTPEDGIVIVNVSVVAPGEQNEEFTGSVRIVNQDNNSDYCKVDVSLSTPKNKPFYFNFNLLDLLLDKFPLLERLLNLPID